MSDKAQKLFSGRTYRERGQLSGRKHLGRLEKKKDYKARADAYNRKAERLKILNRLADNKNPDEFYHRMVSTKLQGGKHIAQLNDKSTQGKQKDIINETSQVLNYLTSKRVSESRKLDRLKNSLPHLSWTPEEALNKKTKSHIVFVDSKEAVDNFEAPEYFDTKPEMMMRKFNRPKNKQLKKIEFECQPYTSLSAYHEVAGRLERCEKLSAMESKLRQKKNLADSYNRPIAKLSDETKTAPAVYKWSCRRQK